MRAGRVPRLGQAANAGERHFLGECDRLQPVDPGIPADTESVICLSVSPSGLERRCVVGRRGEPKNDRNRRSNLKTGYAHLHCRTRTWRRAASVQGRGAIRGRGAHGSERSFGETDRTRISALVHMDTRRWPVGRSSRVLPSGSEIPRHRRFHRRAVSTSRPDADCGSV